MFRKPKRKITSKWLSTEAVQIAEERRMAKSRADKEKVRRLNASFQRKAREDKETSLKDTCHRTEELNQKGKTREFFREIKMITGSFSPRRGTLRSTSGKTLSGDEEVKKRWKEYTEQLYKKNENVVDMLPDVEYDDEPEILPPEVKEALKQLANHKSAGCDGIPAEPLKAEVRMQ